MEIKQVKMIWDTIFVWDYEHRKKIGTYKSGVFNVTRDPSRHTMYKLNAYGFNVAVLEQIYKSNKNAIIIVNQKGTKIKLKIPVEKALHWTYLVFDGEKQVFVNKNDFDLDL